MSKHTHLAPDKHTHGGVQDVKLVQDALDATRLTVPLLARLIVREARNVQGWLDGIHPVPGPVRLRLLELMATDPEERYYEMQMFLARVARFPRRERNHNTRRTRQPKGA